MGKEMNENTQMAEMEQHLLFHKALAEDTESFNRINGYMNILNETNGEKLSDPVDESIRSVFSLVLENGIDPWEIDLREFVRMYSKKVSANTFDMIVAGKLLLMAWKILRLQTEATCAKGAEPVMDDYNEDDFALEDEDPMMAVPEVSFMRAYQRETYRPVSMYELIDAFEDARAEIAIQQERERVRAELKAKEPKKFDNKAHDEDDEKDVERVWERIEKLGAGAIQMSQLYTNNVMEDLRTFVSVLHLVRDGKLNVWQDTLPYGEVFVEIRMPGASRTLEDSAIEAVN
jgi:segregation and condensation protein A